MRPLLALATVLALLPPQAARAYEDYALREGMRCSACHEDTRTFVLTERGRDYVRNGYRFDVAAPTPPLTPRPTPAPAAPPATTGSPMKQLMTRAQEVLEEASRTLALGYYERATRAASELQDLAGKIEAQYRADSRAAGDMARTMRDAAFQLERTLRTDAERRVKLAPLGLSRVLGACLRCHVVEGFSQEDWSRDPGEHGHRGLGERHRPESSTRRPEGAIPSRARRWTGTRR